MDTKTETKPTKTEEKPKQGFFTRIFHRMDSAMKAKAESKSSNSCCCGGKSGDKCC